MLTNTDEMMGVMTGNEEILTWKEEKNKVSY